MRETGLPMTSLPPSIFSVGRGRPALTDAAGAHRLAIRRVRRSGPLRPGRPGATAPPSSSIINQPGSPVEAAAHIDPAHRRRPRTCRPRHQIGDRLHRRRNGASVRTSPPLTPPRAAASGHCHRRPARPHLPQTARSLAALLRASHVYVIGRDTGFGAAQELALKLKETCALHAEAYSSLAKSCTARCNWSPTRCWS